MVRRKTATVPELKLFEEFIHRFVERNGIVVGNEMIALLKETSVAGYVAVIDLTRAANLIRNNTYDAFNPLMVTAVVYLTLVVVMTRLLTAFERRLRESAR